MICSFTAHKYLGSGSSQIVSGLCPVWKERGKKNISKHRARWAVHAPWPFCQTEDKATLPGTEKPDSSESQEGKENFLAGLPTPSYAQSAFKGADNHPLSLHLICNLVGGGIGVGAHLGVRWWVGMSVCM